MAVDLLAGGAMADQPAPPDTTPGAGQLSARPTPVPSVPPVGPDTPPPSAQAGRPSYRPAPVQPAYAPPVNSGPVTGYGPGGMAPAPGAPANPPYSYGGTPSPLR